MRCLHPNVEQVLSGKQVSFTAEVTTSGGQQRSLDTLYVPDQDDRGVVRGYFALVLDVTDRKHAEQEARQTRDELAHAGRIATMGEMAAALAHELNQPLAAILSNAQAAKRFLSAPSPDLEEFREILSDIADDDTRAGEVISRIRSLVKKDRTELRSLNVNTVLWEVIGLLHSDAVIRNVAVLRELDPDLPLVLGDRIQLQQVLLNLLLNAFDAMRDGYSAERVVIVRSRQVDSEILVTVTDRGCGIPENGNEQAGSSSSRSGAPNRAGWEWDCRSAARSSTATADACGPRTITHGGQLSVSAFPPVSTSTRPYRYLQHERTRAHGVRGGRRRLGS